jgi:hypothetical protein
MSNESLAFKYGEINFNEMRVFDKATIRFTIVPEAYLAQDVNNPKNIYMFQTYKDMENYFTDFTKSRI